MNRVHARQHTQAAVVVVAGYKYDFPGVPTDQIKRAGIGGGDLFKMAPSTTAAFVHFQKITDHHHPIALVQQAHQGGIHDLIFFRRIPGADVSI